MRDWDSLIPQLLGPIVSVPRHPLVLARFGVNALVPASIMQRRFDTRQAAALFGGCAAHAFLPLTHPLTSAFGISLALAGHAVGWPVARGGSQVLADAMAARVIELGGEIRVSSPVRSMADLPSRRVALFDTNPAQLEHIAGDLLPSAYRRRLLRFRDRKSVV